jgi:hypothetical protein
MQERGEEKNEGRFSRGEREGKPQARDTAVWRMQCVGRNREEKEASDPLTDASP